MSDGPRSHGNDADSLSTPTRLARLSPHTRAGACAGEPLARHVSLFPARFACTPTLPFVGAKEPPPPRSPSSSSAACNCAARRSARSPSAGNGAGGAAAWRAAFVLDAEVLGWILVVGPREGLLPQGQVSGRRGYSPLRGDFPAPVPWPIRPSLATPILPSEPEDLPICPLGLVFVSRTRPILVSDEGQSAHSRFLSLFIATLLSAAFRRVWLECRSIARGVGSLLMGSLRDSSRPIEAV